MELTLTTENFEKTLTDTKKTLLVDFWAEWCGPCRMQAPVLEAFAAEHEDVQVAKVNVDDNPALAEKFGIMSIPSLLVFKDGKLVNSAVGLRDVAGLEELVK